MPLCYHSYFTSLKKDVNLRHISAFTPTQMRCGTICHCIASFFIVLYKPAEYNYVQTAINIPPKTRGSNASTARKIETHRSSSDVNTYPPAPDWTALFKELECSEEEVGGGNAIRNCAGVQVNEVSELRES
jgi:hypothetical protein